jgi:hypothetical protein
MLNFSGTQDHWLLGWMAPYRHFSAKLEAVSVEPKGAIRHGG